MSQATATETEGAGDATVETPLLASERQRTSPAEAPQLQLSSTRLVGEEFLRTICIFQFGCALPTLFILGILAIAELFEPSLDLYDFVTFLANSLLSTGILFLIVIQRRVSLGDAAKFQFETAKAAFATAMWIWLLSDAIWAHRNGGDYWEGYRRGRVLRAYIASVLLWFLFYPPLGYTGWVWLKTRHASGQVTDNEGYE